MSESTGDQRRAGGDAVGRVALEPEGVPPGTRDDWASAAAAVLRRTGKLPAADGDADPAGVAAVLAALGRSTIEGLPVPPLGIGEAAVPAARRGTATTGGWDIRVLVAHPDPESAGTQALADLEGGAGSLWLRLGDGAVPAESMTSVLRHVLLDVAPVTLDADQRVAAGVYAAFGELLAGRGVTPAPGTTLGADPWGAALRAGTSPDLSALPEVARRADDLGVGALTIDATAAHEAGAGDAQCIAWSLAAAVHGLRTLEAAGVDVPRAAELIGFRYAVTADQFGGIAALRAARQLWHRVLQLCGVANPPQQYQHAVTGRPMFTRYDPWVNMLRGTIAAFAAGAGGAQAITVLPFDSAVGLPEALGRRIARNVSHLLVGESHVATVADPAGGAPAVERLTDEIAAAAWDEFGRIDADGGLGAAHARAAFAERVDAVRRRRAKLIGTRRQPLTGVSEFPHLQETLPHRAPLPDAAPMPESWAAPFERLRDDPPATPVFLATMGTVAAHTARAGFAANALAAGGITTERSGATAGVDELLAGYDPARTPVVCLAGTDAAYAEWGAAAATALRAAGATSVLLSGTPSGELADLVDDHLAIGTAIPDLCLRVRGYLQEQTS